jgi:hypothetical protein
MNNLKIILSLLLILMSTSLFAQRYVYLDGSGNRYDFMSKRIEYIPVKKENSSSGEYSGGTRKDVNVSKEDNKLLKAAFEKAIKATAEHQETREMMTGIVIKGKKNNSPSVILKPDSAAKKELEELLKKLISK